MNYIHPALKAAMTAPAGRPKVNVKPFTLKSTDRVPSGAEYLNTMPTVIKAVHDKYLKLHQLPPALQPHYIRRPEILENKRAKNISKGWNNPRSHK